MSDDPSSSVSSVALAGAIAGILALICSVFYLFFRSPSSSSSSESESEKSEAKKDEKLEKKSSASKTQPSKTTKVDPKSKFIHPWLCASLRAHSAAVTGLDFSHNDKYLASAAEDDSVLLWQTKEVEGKEHRHARVNVEFGRANRVAFSPDGR